MHFSYQARAKRRKIETSDDSKGKKSKVKQENQYEPFPFKRSPHQTPYPSRDTTPDPPSSPSKSESLPKSLPLEHSVTSPKKEESEESQKKVLEQSPSKLSSSPCNYKCYYCGDKFSKMSIRMEHMKSVHSNQIKGWAGGSVGRGKLRSDWIKLLFYRRMVHNNHTCHQILYLENFEKFGVFSKLTIIHN